MYCMKPTKKLFRKMMKSDHWIHQLLLHPIIVIKAINKRRGWATYEIQKTYLKYEFQNDKYSITYLHLEYCPSLISDCMHATVPTYSFLLCIKIILFSTLYCFCYTVYCSVQVHFSKYTVICIKQSVWSEQSNAISNLPRLIWFIMIGV